MPGWRKIDDGQTTKPQSDPGVGIAPDPRVIGTAKLQSRRHAPDDGPHLVGCLGFGKI